MVKLANTSGLKSAASAYEFESRQDYSKFKTVTMKTKIQKSALLEVLLENKQKHVAEFTQAKENYLKVVEEAILKVLEDFKSTHVVNYNPIATLRSPRSHEDEYNTAIAMLNYNVDEEIELEEHEFKELVLDQWQWQQEFKFTNSTYGVK